MTSRVDTTPCDVEPQPYSLTADWLGLGHKGNATIWEDIESCTRFRNPDKTGDDNRFLPRIDAAPHDGATIIYYSHWIIVEWLCSS